MPMQTDDIYYLWSNLTEEEKNNAVKFAKDNIVLEKTIIEECHPYFEENNPDLPPSILPREPTQSVAHIQPGIYSVKCEKCGMWYNRDDFNRDLEDENIVLDHILTDHLKDIKRKKLQLLNITDCSSDEQMYFIVDEFIQPETHRAILNDIENFEKETPEWEYPEIEQCVKDRLKKEGYTVYDYHCVKSLY